MWRWLLIAVVVLIVVWFLHDSWSQLRLEIRSAASKEPLAAASGINLATLIEIFSRPSRPQQDRWSLESAPFQLADLKSQQ